MSRRSIPVSGATGAGGGFQNNTNLAPRPHCTRSRSTRSTRNRTRKSSFSGTLAALGSVFRLIPIASVVVAATTMTSIVASASAPMPAATVASRLCFRALEMGKRRAAPSAAAPHWCERFATATTTTLALAFRSQTSTVARRSSSRSACDRFPASAPSSACFSSSFVRRRIIGAAATMHPSPPPLSSITSSFSTASDEHDNDASSMTENEARMTKDARSIVDAAIKAVDPYVAVRDRLRVEKTTVEGSRDGVSASSSSSSETASRLIAQVDGDGARTLSYDLSDYDDVRILAFGKASAAMAAAAAEVISEAFIASENGERNGPRKMSGVVVVKDDHATDDEIQTLRKNYGIAVRSASHPVPDARSVAAADEILEHAASSTSRTLVVACISGGGSALFCSPREPLTLEDLAHANSALLASGMPIEKMNVIRKRLERGKGGRLAAEAYPATVLTLILSDIVGDPLNLIASGPTVPDNGSGWEEACLLVEEYGLGRGGEHEFPDAVLKLLLRGRGGELDDTPGSSHPAFSLLVGNEGEGVKRKRHSETVLVGNNDAAVMAAAKEAERRGYHPLVLGTRIEGEASHVAGVYVAMAEMLSRQRKGGGGNKYQMAPLPAALIAGGETTVTLPKDCDGRGGRNQELALSAAIKMKAMGLRDVVLASVGTDGTDGPTDAAGAVVDGAVVERLGSRGVSAAEALRGHDAYNFFGSSDDAAGTARDESLRPLVHTGPTGTNVADVCIVLVM